MTSISISIPITTNDQDNWKEVAIEENGEPLIQLKPSLITDRLLLRPFYFNQNVPHAIEAVFLRQAVVEKLLRIANMLPNGLKLCILDGWRPYAVQNSLYDQYADQICKAYPNLSDTEKNTLIEQYVSRPSLNNNCPSPHLTGGAVDLTLIGEDGVDLPMGTAFDAFTEKAQTRYYEALLEAGISLKSSDHQILHNRRLLYHMMVNEGFTNYSDEWWHYDYGNQLWGSKVKQAAKYGGQNRPWHKIGS